MFLHSELNSKLPVHVRLNPFAVIELSDIKDTCISIPCSTYTVVPCFPHLLKAVKQHGAISFPCEQSITKIISRMYMLYISFNQIIETRLVINSQTHAIPLNNHHMDSILRFP